MVSRLLILSMFLTCTAFVAEAQYANSLTVEPLLKTDTTSIGQPIAYPQVGRAEVTVLKITMPPGSNTGWHKHDIPLFAYVVQGELTVTREQHEPRVFRGGEAVAEMTDVYHEGANLGEEDVVLIAFYLGGDDKPLAIPRAKPAPEPVTPIPAETSYR